MYVNTQVVRALMQLRGITDVALSSLAHVTGADLRAWLNEEGEDSAERVEFDTQLEILKLLGVHGEQPRGDLVHYWRIHEELFSKNSANYWALQVLLRTFGPAQASYLAPEQDPMLNFSARAHFGLRFDHFLAIVEITAHPLRNISFGPEILSGLTWTPECMGVLLPEAEFKRLQPGAMRVRAMTQYLTYTTEVKHWERLRETALDQGIRAEQVAKLLLGDSQGAALLAGPAAAADAPQTQPVPAASSNEFSPTDGGGGGVPSEAAVAAETPAPTVKAPVEVRTPASESPDAMRLFMTPVKPVVKAPEQAEAGTTHLRRVQ